MSDDCKFCSTPIRATNVAREYGKDTCCDSEICLEQWKAWRMGEPGPLEAYVFDDDTHSGTHRSSNLSPRRENMDGNLPTEQKFQSKLEDDASLANVMTMKKKLIFNALTPAKIVEITFNETGREPAPKSEDTKVRMTIKVKSQLLTQIDGQVDVYTNYGVSIYEKKTGEKTLYWGSTTDASKLRDMVSDASGIAANEMDLLKLKNYLLGKTVYLKSETRNNPQSNTEVSKALIKQIKVD
jgi:hypothetical protein